MPLNPNRQQEKTAAHLRDLTRARCGEGAAGGVPLSRWASIKSSGKGKRSMRPLDRVFEFEGQFPGHDPGPRSRRSAWGQARELRRRPGGEKIAGRFVTSSTTLTIPIVTESRTIRSAEAGTATRTSALCPSHRRQSASGRQ